MQIELSEYKDVLAISTQGGRSIVIRKWVTQYQVAYSQNNVNWEFVKSDDGTVLVINFLIVIR